MIVTKVVVYCSVFISLSLSLASNKSSGEIRWNYGQGGVNPTLDNELFRQLLELGPSYRIVRQSPIELLHFIRHKDKEVPDSFDSRQNWPKCGSLLRIKNQLPCETSWAFAGGSVISDRFCIKSDGSDKFDPSEQDIITCGEKGSGSNTRCNSSHHMTAVVQHFMNHEVVDAECKPYDVKTIDDGCKQSCVNGKPYEKRKFNISFIAGAVVAMEYSHPKQKSTLKDIQIEIMTYGPVISGLVDTPDDFQKEYTNQVYMNNKKIENASMLSNRHFVKIIGWGVENETPYWLCANSWGETWGQLKGFFKIKRGSNELGIERMFVTYDTDPGSRPNVSENGTIIFPNSSPTSFTKILHFYKITVIAVVIALFV